MPFDKIVGRLRIAYTPTGILQQISTKDGGSQTITPIPKYGRYVDKISSDGRKYREWRGTPHALYRKNKLDASIDNPPKP